MAQNTKNNDRSCLDRLARSVGPDRQVGNIKATDIQNFFREFDGQAPASWNKSKQRVAGFLAFCQRQQWVVGDWLGDVPKKKTVRRERLRLAPDELVALVDKPDDPRDRAFLTVAVNSGLRSSEIVSLRVGDIDLENSRLHIFRQKTGQADILVLTPALRKRLDAWLGLYAAELRFLAYDKDGQLAEGVTLDGSMLAFPARGKNVRTYDSTPGHRGFGSLRPWSPISRPHRIVQEALGASGFDIKPGEGCHTVRRSVSRALFDSSAAQGIDASLRLVAALLGHASVTTTEGYIGVTHDKVKRDQVMALDFLPFDQESAEVIPIREVQAF
jgi:integrase